MKNTARSETVPHNGSSAVRMPVGPVTTTFVLGAGFSKCADLPLQADFSPLMLSDEFATPLDKVITRALKQFLREVFGWRPGRELPSLEDIFTCIDLATATGHHLGIKYTPKCLRAIRRMAVYRIFAVLDRQFTYSPEIQRLLEVFCPAGVPPRAGFVVLNWDTVLERHLLQANPAAVIDYCCPCADWSRPAAPPPAGGIPVCKIHGSSNWVYCDNCKSLFFDLDKKLSLQTKAGLVKSDFRLFDDKFTGRQFASALGMPAHERECRFCGYVVSSHIATFSYRKSFRTPAYSAIWFQAEKLLARSDRWVFIGYSLPEADYELKHLLKAAQLQLAHQRKGGRRLRIEVIMQGDEPTRKKFERFFGAEALDFFEGGLAEYVAKHTAPAAGKA